MAPLEAAGHPVSSAATASPRRSSAATLSYPVNGGQPALLAGQRPSSSRRACERVSAGAARHPRAATTMPWLLNTGLQGSATAERRRTSGPRRTRPSYDRGGRSGAASGGRQRPTGCVTAVLGDRTETFFDSFRRLRTDDGNVRISSVLGSVGQPLIDRTGGRESPFEGAYVTGWYPDAGDARWDADARGDPEARLRRQPASTRTTRASQTTWIAYTVLKEIVAGDRPSRTITAGKLTRRPEPGRQGGHRRPHAGAALALRGHARVVRLPAHREPEGDVPGGAGRAAGGAEARASWT